MSDGSISVVKKEMENWKHELWKYLGMRWEETETKLGITTFKSLALAVGWIEMSFYTRDGKSQTRVTLEQMIEDLSFI